jgi:hypothetical protein
MSIVGTDREKANCIDHRRGIAKVADENIPASDRSRASVALRYYVQSKGSVVGEGKMVGLSVESLKGHVAV